MKYTMQYILHAFLNFQPYPPGADEDSPIMQMWYRQARAALATARINHPGGAMGPGWNSRVG